MFHGTKPWVEKTIHKTLKTNSSIQWTNVDQVGRVRSHHTNWSRGRAARSHKPVGCEVRRSKRIQRNSWIQWDLFGMPCLQVSHPPLDGPFSFEPGSVSVVLSKNWAGSDSLDPFVPLWFLSKFQHKSLRFGEGSERARMVDTLVGSSRPVCKWWILAKGFELIHNQWTNRRPIQERPAFPHYVPFPWPWRGWSSYEEMRSVITWKTLEPTSIADCIQVGAPHRHCCSSSCSVPSRLVEAAPLSLGEQQVSLTAQS